MDIVYFLLVTIAGIGIAVGGMWFILHRDRRLQTEADQARRREEDRAEEFGRWEVGIRDFVSGRPLRYEIRVADWGPDFTGEGDTLPRWRWAIVDADLDIKEYFRVEHKADTPFMLGNAPTAREAYLDALAWIERQGAPMLVVGMPDAEGLG